MKRIFGNAFFWILMFLVVVAVISVFQGDNEEEVQFNVQEFQTALGNGEIEEMTMQPANGIVRFTGTLVDDEQSFIAQVPDNTMLINSITEQANEQSALNVIEEEQPSAFVSFLTMMLPFLIIGLIFFFILSRAQGGGGGGGGKMMNFGKSKAKMYTEETKKVRFSDVAGADEEKQELVEVGRKSVV